MVENARPSELNAEADVVEKKLFCVFQKSVDVVEKKLFCVLQKSVDDVEK